jgi:hypothetical protein
LEDVFLVLTDEEQVFEIEQQAPFFDELYAIVSTLKGFDYDKVIKAMRSVDNAEFVCWEKKA